MNFLKRLFSRAFSTEQSTERTDLAEGGRSGRTDRQRSAAPRVQVFWLHNLSYLPYRSFDNKAIPVANLSSSGIGLLASPGPGTPKVGDRVRGTLSFSNDLVPVELEVKHITRTLVGCQFLGDVSALQQKIQKYFDLELAALSMKAAAASEIQWKESGRPIWFRGDGNCYLFYVLDGVGVRRFHLAFFANYFEGGSDVATRHGRISEVPCSEPPVYIAPQVQWETKASAQMIDHVVRFLSNIKTLAPDHRNQIVEMIRRFPVG